MRLLVVHTWLRGNLGDVLQASVLLRGLRELRPSTLDLGGFPRKPGAGARELVALADRHVPEPFAWHLHLAPAALRARFLEPDWRRRRAALFSRYDAIVSAPGPFLAEYDARWHAALADLDVAVELGMPFILSSHSVGPLPDAALARLRRATVCVAREGATHEYLARHGVPSVRSADYAFLFPFDEVLGRRDTSSPSEPYRVLILRSRNLKASRIERTRGSLRLGEHLVPLDPAERLVVATSDAHRDRRFVKALSSRLDADSVVCGSVAELLALISRSTGVISDRYHPVICAVALGKPAEILPNKEAHKMEGLKGLVAGNELETLRSLSRAGLSAVKAALVPAGAPRVETRT
jgi:polysaccharide pyruvyl transferase WcaK-like protein